MANYFVIPDTGQIVYSGDVVLLSEYSNIKWIARYGWYTYNASQMKGWYFSSIPDNNIVPSSQVDLSLITIISSNHRPGPGPQPGPFPPGPGPFPPGPIPPGPMPPGPFPPFTPKDAEMLSRSAVTVDSIKQRDTLNDGTLPDGKIVRVNSGPDDKPAYYEWDTATMSWLDLDLGDFLIKSLDDFSPDIIVTTEETPEEGDDTTISTTGRILASIDEATAAWIDLDAEDD